MKSIYSTALTDLTRRIECCRKAASKPNTMIDCDWSDVRYRASWMQEMYKAIYKREKLLQRLNHNTNKGVSYDV